MKKIGLAYAMTGEIESLLRQGDARLLETVSGVDIYEIEPGILAYTSGVGKVNAAIGAQIFIDRYQPDWIVNAGVAGCFHDVPIGTIVLAEGFIQHDMDTSPMGDPIGFVSTVNTIDFPTDDIPGAKSILLNLGVEHVTGKVATGDAFLTRGPRADWVAKTFSPFLCEMEGGAVAQVCLRNGVKFTALKSVSDRLIKENNAAEYFNFAETMVRLNRVVLPFAQALRDREEKA